MKMKLLFPVLVLLCARCFGDEVTKLADEKAKAKEIFRRVENSRENNILLYDAAELPAAEVMPGLIRFALDRSTDPARSAIAVEVIRHIKNYVPYFEGRLSRMKEMDEVQKARLFEVLALIGTLDAAKLVARYLFDDSVPQVTASDVIPTENKKMAAMALSGMGFGDNPSPKDPVLYTDDDVHMWRKWAVDHGLVPKGWISQPASKSPLPSVPTQPTDTNTATQPLGFSERKEVSEEAAKQTTRISVAIIIIGAIGSLIVGLIVWKRGSKTRLTNGERGQLQSEGGGKGVVRERGRC